MRVTESSPHRTAPLGAAVLALSGVVVTAVCVVIDVAATGADRSASQMGFGAINAAIGALVMVAAAVIWWQRPGHRVGWVLAAVGVVWNLDGLSESWAAYAGPRDLAGVDLSYWVVARFGAFLLTGLVLLLVIYPSGHRPSGRAGVIGAVAVALAAVLPVALQLAPDSLMYDDLGVTGLHTEWIPVDVPEGLAIGLLVLGQVSVLVAVVTALVLLVVRHRRAGDEERTQLRWLLWAGILCALTVVVVLLTGTATLATNIALGFAVVTTAASLAVGVVRPRIADVDSLVAGTLTFAGVATVVIGFDLGVIALASTVLHDRLDERDVTVLVLLLAVLVYGPLRTWLGGLVRRLLFGGRADRYRAVSTFAARLEETQSVEEQLPALAAAVASAFKLSFVRVEVVHPGGGAIAASRGTPGEDTQSLDIAYGGERIGRLELPRHGLRAMLSARDQGLLLDLVRQGAIAVRTSLLAEEVQESRERLVLAREEDRRRIRRDLHDGLGPVLGGVAMRLDAAGNAVEPDPDRARQLIRQSRTEIRDALDDVRRLVHDLRPPALDDLGLLAAVQQQAERASTQLDVDVVAEDLSGLPAAVEVAAYRIVSESLANVVRHSGASRCVIRLTPGTRALDVEVCDDGRGIAADVTAGVGLLSLRERADELGGQCQVTCPESGGTRVSAWLPYGDARRERMT